MQWFEFNLADSRWGRSGKNAAQLRVKGPVYWDGTPCTNESLVHHLSQAQTTSDLILSLNRLNGFYAWVEATPERIRAAVDHIRSRPLFYANLDGRFFLSDDAEWIRQQVGDQKMDPIARDELHLAGYVTGAETLFPNVKQLQAGEFLVATQQDGVISVETHRYYRFLHSEPEQIDEPTLRARLDEVAVTSVQRLIDYANGRQIVVPLSGGYDSRLIVTLLRRLGYGNILTFTYGLQGNKESAYSKRVADALGLPWHFVEYSEALWRQSWQTPERWHYQKWASGWNSIAHVQDWLAVKILKEQGVLQEYSVFAPGHCCVTGLLPSHVFSKNQVTAEEFIRDLIAQHFSNAPHELFDLSKNGGLLKHLERFTPKERLFSVNDYARNFMEFGWQERQAKFIGNSVRIYEFYGFDWWMPLWDREFIEFWERVPLELRIERRWYTSFVKEQFAIFAKNLNSNGANLNNASDRPYIIGLFKKSSVLKIIKKNYFFLILQRKIYKQRPSSGHHLGFWGAFDSGFSQSLIKQGFSWHGVRAVAFLRDFGQKLMNE